MRRAAFFVPAALGLLGAGILLGRPGGIPEAGTARAAAARRARSEAVLGPPKAEGVRDGVARLFALEAGPSPLETLVGRLKEHFHALNDEEILHVRSRLARLLEERPETALELAALFEREEDGDVLLLAAQVLGENAAAMEDPALVALLVRVAEQGPHPAGRGGALLVLMHLPRLDDGVTAAVLRLAGAEAEHPDLRASAIATVNAWMAKHPEGAARLSEALLDVARRASSSDVRGHAAQAVALQDLPLGASAVETMGGFLRDPDPRVRGVAALALGSPAPEARAAALRHLEGAVDRAGLIHLVRAAGPEAEAALARVAGRAPALAEDVRDYLEILAAERDPARVWELKQRRDVARGIVAGADEHHD